MNYTFPVHIQLNPATRQAEAAVIPDLDYTRIDLQTAAAKQAIEAMGRTRYLELCITALLREKDDNDDDIPAPNSIESYESPRYPLYLFTTFAACQPGKLPGHALVLVGTGDQRQAYFAEQQQWGKSRQHRLSLPVTLTAATRALLDAAATDNHQAIDITVANGTLLEPFVRQLLNQAKRVTPSPDDYWLPIRVHHRSRHRCHCCEDYLPTITRITLTLEWLAIIPITAGTLKITAKKFLPFFGNDALNYSTYITTIMNTLVVWYMTTRGPGSEQQNVLGHSFDTLFHAAQRLISCTSPHQNRHDPAANMDPTGRMIRLLLQIMLAIFTLVFLLTTTAQDFTGTFIMAAAIDDPDAWPAPSVTNTMAYVGFGLNQFNDPALMMGFVMFGLAEIKNHLHRRRLAQSRAQVEEVTEEKNEDTVDLERGENKKAELHERLLATVQPLSPRLLLHGGEGLSHVIANRVADFNSKNMNSM